MFQEPQHRRRGERGGAVGSDLSQLTANGASKAVLPRRPALDEPQIRELIAVADTAKRLHWHPISNLLFAYLTFTPAEELRGKLFLEERTVSTIRTPHRFYDLYALQLSEPRAYLCIPYPLLNREVARHFETIATCADPVVHQRRYYTGAATVAEQQKALVSRLFGAFSSDTQYERLITAARTVLDPKECFRAFFALRHLSLEHFRTKMPRFFERLEESEVQARRLWLRRSRL